MLLQDEQYVVKWLSQYGALPKAQITKCFESRRILPKRSCGT